MFREFIRSMVKEIKIPKTAICGLQSNTSKNNKATANGTLPAKVHSNANQKTAIKTGSLPSPPSSSKLGIVPSPLGGQWMRHEKLLWWRLLVIIIHCKGALNVGWSTLAISNCQTRSYWPVPGAFFYIWIQPIRSSWMVTSGCAFKTFSNLDKIISGHK